MAPAGQEDRRKSKEKKGKREEEEEEGVVDQAKGTKEQRVKGQRDKGPKP